MWAVAIQHYQIIETKLCEIFLSSNQVYYKMLNNNILVIDGNMYHLILQYVSLIKIF